MRELSKDESINFALFVRKPLGHSSMWALGYMTKEEFLKLASQEWDESIVVGAYNPSTGCHAPSDEVSPIADDIMSYVVDHRWCSMRSVIEALRGVWREKDIRRIVWQLVEHKQIEFNTEWKISLVEQS